MSARILVVDDSAMVRHLVSGTLSQAGFSVHQATNGQDALDKLNAAPDTALVICDVNMPVMDGIEFLEHVHRMEKPYPVVMLTTEGEPELIARAKSLGAKGWIVKPFKPDMMVATAKKLTAQAM